MPTATGWQTCGDLQAAFEARRIAQYRRLQRLAAEAGFERKHGRKPANLDELAAACRGGTVETIDPLRYLDEATCARVMAGATG